MMQFEGTLSPASPHSTMVQISQESRRKYWATRLSVRSFTRTAHLFACSGLLASLTPSAALTRSLARSLRSLPRSWESEFLMSQNDLVLSHSGLTLHYLFFPLLFPSSVFVPSINLLFFPTHSLFQAPLLCLQYKVLKLSYSVNPPPTIFLAQFP